VTPSWLQFYIIFSQKYGYAEIPKIYGFCPTKNLGMNIPNLYTVQETTRLLDMMSHMAKLTTTGSLYRTLVDLLVIKVGMGMDVLNLDFNKLSILGTNSLVKRSWKFLHNTHYATPKRRRLSHYDSAS
jgi:hypothetical protein